MGKAILIVIGIILLFCVIFVVLLAVSSNPGRGYYLSDAEAADQAKAITEYNKRHDKNRKIFDE